MTKDSIMPELSFKHVHINTNTIERFTESTDRPDPMESATIIEISQDSSEWGGVILSGNIYFTTVQREGWYTGQVFSYSPVGPIPLMYTFSAATKEGREEVVTAFNELCGWYPDIAKMEVAWPEAPFVADLYLPECIEPYATRFALKGEFSYMSQCMGRAFFFPELFGDENN